MSENLHSWVDLEKLATALIQQKNSMLDKVNAYDCQGWPFDRQVLSMIEVLETLVVLLPVWVACGRGSQVVPLVTRIKVIVNNWLCQVGRRHNLSAELLRIIEICDRLISDHCTRVAEERKIIEG